MGMHIPYSQDIYRLPDALSPGNSVTEQPIQFTLEPAWGPDLARIKSVIFATAGLVQFSDWSPDMQNAVTEAFEHGARAFINTITKIEGLTIPALMAKRAGLIPALPTKVVDGQPVPDPQAPVPILDGLAFSKICGSGSVLALSMSVAARIASLSEDAQVDPRFFAQPSGSGGPETRPATATTATAARPTSRRRGTAGKGGRKKASRH